MAEERQNYEQTQERAGDPPHRSHLWFQIAHHLSPERVAFVPLHQVALHGRRHAGIAHIVGHAAMIHRRVPVSRRSGEAVSHGDVVDSRAVFELGVRIEGVAERRTRMLGSGALTFAGVTCGA